MNVNRGKAHGRKGKASTRSKSSLYDYLYTWKKRENVKKSFFSLMGKQRYGKAQLFY